MIISHEHRFIFLKTAKTAGTSVEAALLTSLGPNDVVAGTSRPPTRAKPRRSGRNHLRGLGRLGIHVPSSIGGFMPQISGFYPHMRASQVRAMIGDDIWNSYFKFTTERNPWDRQISLFFYRHKRKKGSTNLTFEAFLTSPWYTALHSVRVRNWETYSIGNSIAVDRVLRFENIEKEFAELRSTLGLKNSELPHKNAGPKRNRHDYRSYYNADTKAVIERWYRHEIEAFDYTF